MSVTQTSPGDTGTKNGAGETTTTRAPRRTSPPSGPAKLTIQPIQTELLAIDIIGTAPLIVSRFSEKAKTQMLASQQGVKRQPERRDPEREFLASLYRAGIDPETGEIIFGLPAMAFKMATIGAGRYYGKQVKMTELRQFMFFYGVSVATEPSKMVVLKGRPRIREDYVRLAGVNHPADLRYRGCFDEWEATLYVSYTENLLDRDSLVSLIEAGGMGVGVGEWRPERNGEFGTFQIAEHRGAIRVLDALPPEYRRDVRVNFQDSGVEPPRILTMADFAKLDAPPDPLPKATRSKAAAADGEAEDGEGTSEDSGDAV